MSRFLLSSCMATALISIAMSAGICAAQGFPHDRHHPSEVVGPPLVIDQAAATTVQLPTFSFFSISTTVMVPDSGTGFIGGVGRGGAGLHSNGLGSRAGASGVDVGGMSIGVQVHDFKAMDRALLGEKKAVDAQAAAEDRWIARFERAKQSTAGRPTLSVAEARRRAGAAR